ncbi:hypothetical protein F5H01DRAFT_378071 [Linnemannia elongata]|nr:hypothetical protein F5H01DRAFT_378071 [Linnemannia elongata]
MYSTLRKIIQGDTPQAQVQAFRSVDKSILPSTVPLATPEEAIHIDTQLDPETQKEVVLWDDILQAFKNADLVRHKTRVVPFLKGKDFTILQPRRIAAIPDAILDVIIDTSVIDSKETPSDATSAVRRNPVYGLVETAMENYTHIDRPLAFPSARGPQASVSEGAAAGLRRGDVNMTENVVVSHDNNTTTTSSVVRRNPVYGLVETAMENYTHIDRPLASPSARGPQAATNEQARLAKDLSVPPHSDIGNNSLLRGSQNTTIAAKKDLAQLGISASQGEAAAQVALGDMYRDGNGVPRDDQAAFDWYLQAAEQGDPIGQIRLGELYQYGQGVPQDYAQSLDWYLLAANRGNIRAQREIADLYYNGRGVTKDYVQAMVWYRKAADQGDAGSQCKVGSLYEYGSGVGYDHLKAAEWYQKAADQGHAFAKKCLRALKDKGMPDK